MSDLTAAREWVARARQLLGERRQASFGEQAETLRGELATLLETARTGGQLAPELLRALEEMAGAFGSASGPDDEAPAAAVGAPEDDDEAAARQLFQDFRADYRQRREALAAVLTPGEAGSLDLSLELADAQAGLGQYATATTLLQKAAHRAAAIEAEGRVDEAADALRIHVEAEQARDREARERQKAEQAEAARRAFGAIVDRFRALDPVLPGEKTACGVFSRFYMELMAADRFDDATTLLAEWSSAFDAWSTPGSPNQTRREALARRRETAGRLEKPGDTAAAVEAIERKKAAARDDLIATSLEISDWNGGRPHPLEKRIGEWVHEVDRHLAGLKDPKPADDGDAAREARAKRLIQAEDALAVLQGRQAEADEALVAAKQAIGPRIAAEQKALATFVDAQEKVVQARQDDADTRHQALDDHLKATRNESGAGGGRAVQQPFSEQSRTFYAAQITKLKDLKKPTEAEKTQLRIARAIVAAATRNDALLIEAAAADQRLAEAQKVLADGRAPLDDAVERAKRAQRLTWPAPAAIVYGTPLGAAQLNATLPKDGSGRIAYRFDGRPIVAGTTRLRAGAGQRLQAVVVDADAAMFQPTPPAEVAIDVSKGAVALTGVDALAFDYGTAFDPAALAVVVATTPPMSDDHDRLAKGVTFTTGGKPLAKGAILRAGDHVVIAAHPGDDDHAPSSVLSVDVKVHPAARTLAAGNGTPGPVGAVVQATDLRQLARLYTVTVGAGTVEFRIGDQLLAVGAKLAAGKKRKLRVGLEADANYQPVAELTAEIDVLGVAEHFDAVKQSGATLLAKKVHTQHQAAIAQLQQQVEALAAAADDADKFARIDALRAEIETIEANLVTWQGPVPAPKPGGDGKLLDVQIAPVATDTAADKKRKTVAETVTAATKLVQHGGIPLKDIERLVPSGTPNTYASSPNYPDGFKYIWVTAAGVTMEVYGHGPTTALNVPAASDSKKGNLVRVKIDGEYLKPDGTLTPQSTDATSHMALY